MSVFSAEEAPIGMVQNIEDDRIILLGASGSIYEGGHYQAAPVLVGRVQEGRVFLSNDAEAALILEESYLALSPEKESVGDTRSRREGDAKVTSYPNSDNGTAVLVGLVFVCAVAAIAIPLIFGRRKVTETRPQQAGEAATTRFGMEDGDNTDIPATEPYLR